MEDYTTTELKVLEGKFYKDCADKYNKSADAFLEPLLDKMLEIARKELKETYMRKYSTKEFRWDGLSLYLGDELISKVIAVGEMYRIQWPDGVFSEDSYNLSRAKDNAIKHAILHLNLDTQQSPTDGP